MSSSPFQFKQFAVAQDQCAMKIGTDGVLLGAWTNIPSTTSKILDIGAGTGVIALQLAQRSSADTIDAVEIDEAAYEQCTENFENSSWADRLFCYHASIQEFASEIDEQYDLIVSNPPFYTEDYKTSNNARDAARFNDAMPFKHLTVCAAHLLEEHGTLAVILPKKEEENFIAIAETQGLFSNRICRVKGNPTSEEKRSLIEFSFKETHTVIENLTIETERHKYTKQYEALVSSFYLKM